MGVRAGQGYGQAKPKRRHCPQCQKHGVTQWKATDSGLVRHCQYCQMSWGEEGWRLATEVVDHVCRPLKTNETSMGKPLSKPQQLLVNKLISGAQLNHSAKSGLFRLRDGPNERTIHPATVQSLINAGLLLKGMSTALRLAQ